MLDEPPRVRVEGLDWRGLFPFLLIFNSFRMAIHPAKLFLALLMVVMTYLGGLALDSIWGDRVFPHELQTYLERSPEHYANWTRIMENSELEVEMTGVFETMLRHELLAFRDLMTSAVSLDFGFDRVLLPNAPGTGGVMGALTTMVVDIPAWMYTTHTWFLAAFLLYVFLLTVIFGGAISRLAAVQATREMRPSPFVALRFVGRKWVWFFFAPIIPLLGALVTGLILALIGVLFNAPVLDLIGAAILPIALIGGFIIAMLLVLMAGAGNLLFPAIAIEGTDAFDAVSRAFSYVMGRPWRFLFYTLAALVYGAITYTFVAFVVYLVLWATKAFVGLLVFTEAVEGVGRFDAMLPDPNLDRLPFHDTRAADANEGWSVTTSRAMITVWVKLLIGLLPAFAFSFYFCAQTWIYLLLRQNADGTELDAVYLDPDEQPEPVATDIPDKVEADAGA